MSFDALAKDLATRPFRFSTEKQLGDLVAARLSALGLSFEREVVLDKGDVVDFLLGCGTALELKIDGRPTDIARQLARYAMHERVSSIALITSRMKHRAMPASLAGKPIRVLYLAGATFG